MSTLMLGSIKILLDFGSSDLLRFLGRLVCSAMDLLVLFCCAISSEEWALEEASLLNRLIGSLLCQC